VSSAEAGPAEAPPLRVAVLGHGVMGRRRAALVAAHPGLTLAAVCDPALEALEALEKLTGLYGPREPARPPVAAFTGWREALAAPLEPPLDAAMVCLPNDLNAEVTAAALARGLHVLCEKPPARTVAELEAVAAALRPGLTLAYGFNHRRHGSVKDARALLDELGPVLHLRGVYGKSAVSEIPGNWRGDPVRAGGGILMDQGIHMVDLMRCFAGPFDEVLAMRRGPGGHEEDAFALLRARSGAVASLHSSATQWRHRFSLHLGCARGALELDGILSGSMSYAPEILRIWRRAPDTGRVGAPEERRYQRDDSWREEVDAFALAAASGAGIEGGGLADARATLALVERIYDAASPRR